MNNYQDLRPDISIAIAKAMSELGDNHELVWMLKNIQTEVCRLLNNVKK